MSRIGNKANQLVDALTTLVFKIPFLNKFYKKNLPLNLIISDEKKFKKTGIEIDFEKKYKVWWKLDNNGMFFNNYASKGTIASDVLLLKIQVDNNGKNKFRKFLIENAYIDYEQNYFRISFFRNISELKNFTKNENYYSKSEVNKISKATIKLSKIYSAKEEIGLLPEEIIGYFNAQKQSKKWKLLKQNKLTCKKEINNDEKEI
ncbi:hypothetical protein EI74_0620 [Mycoplasma testudineum]|uniref:Uncharacterized protein n=1 Tax=Mycoplasma testudineum TaxID=244584 RepID=A0A4R6IFW1_9MOLU|nr:hypothetical protein [Mycoplasma testudineum]OYD26686.1 hypothetical protein CG473_02705 [Mycoplasma testudineum]TDO19815.1 hypothetical protein EI74_0620 [Mycoplasma testudineum]